VATSALGTITVTAYSNNTCTVLAGGTLTNNALTANAGVVDYTAIQDTIAETIYIKGVYTDTNGFIIPSQCSSPIIVRPGIVSNLIVTQAPSSDGVPTVPLKVQPILSNGWIFNLYILFRQCMYK
jgi:type V secretory pathway adhesin AidA